MADNQEAKNNNTPAPKTVAWRQEMYVNSAGHQITGRFVIGDREPEGWVTYFGNAVVRLPNGKPIPVSFPIEGAQTIQQAFAKFQAAAAMEMPKAAAEVERQIAEQRAAQSPIINPGGNPFDGTGPTPPLRG